MYKTFQAGAVVALTALTLGACSDSDITTPDDNALTGTFEASRIDFAQNGSEQPVDMVSQGATLTLNLDQTAGSFQSSFRNGHPDPVGVEGVLSVDGDQLVLGDSPFLNDDITTETVFDLQANTDKVFLQGDVMLVVGDEATLGDVAIELQRIE